MKKQSNSLIIIVLALMAGGVALFMYMNSNQTEPTTDGTTITSFEDCIAAGYDIMESFPRQCATPDGRRFTEEVETSPLDDIEPPAERVISLYYYNAEQDTDTAGNIQCTAAGLVAVERTIPITETPLQDAVNLLLIGNLSEEEIARGISTEFPLSGLSLEGVTVDDDGVLVLQFDDPESTTTGGSCRTNILWQQIQATATQFDTVDEVRFAPEELFQP